MAVELFSTDVPPRGVSLVHEDYQTRKCQCRIRDVACLGWYSFLSLISFFLSFSLSHPLSLVSLLFSFSLSLS